MALMGHPVFHWGPFKHACKRTPSIGRAPLELEIVGQRHAILHQAATPDIASLRRWYFFFLLTAEAQPANTVVDRPPAPAIAALPSHHGSYCAQNGDRSRCQTAQGDQISARVQPKGGHAQGQPAGDEEVSSRRRPTASFPKVRLTRPRKMDHRSYLGDFGQ